MDWSEKSKKVARKVRMPKGLIYFFIAAITLVIMFVAAGVAYTYYSGSDASGVMQATSEDSEDQGYYEPSLGGTEPADDANVGVSLQTMSKQVRPGSNALIGIRTLPEAECTILVEYDEVESQDSGLMMKTANRFGMVDWTWTVEEFVPEGEWPIEVTCERNEKSGVLHNKLEVTYDLDD